MATLTPAPLPITRNVVTEHFFNKYKTAASALEFAISGDVLRFPAGRYTSRIVIDKAVTVVFEEGARLEYSGTDSAVEIQAACTLIGLFVENTGSGEAIYDATGTYAITGYNCRFKGNSLTPSGIDLTGATSDWHNCIFETSSAQKTWFTADNVEFLGTVDLGTLTGYVIGTDVQAWSAVLDATTASFLTADETKLDGIEALADVTDATNVTAAGAHMSGGTDVPVTDGGTGSSTASDARTALGVAIGSDVQAYDAALDAVTGTNTGDEVSATTSTEGIVELATQAEVDAGTDTTRVVTPETLAAYSGLSSFSEAQLAARVLMYS